MGSSDSIPVHTPSLSSDSENEWGYSFSPQLLEELHRRALNVKERPKSVSFNSSPLQIDSLPKFKSELPEQQRQKQQFIQKQQIEQQKHFDSNNNTNGSNQQSAAVVELIERGRQIGLVLREELP